MINKTSYLSDKESLKYIVITGLVGLSLLLLFIFGLAYLDKEKAVAKAYKDAAIIVSVQTSNIDSTINEINKTNARYNLVLDSIENKNK